ncbi:MAG: strictosidine synthase family protein [Candidatus Binatia bacterium]
MKRVLLLLLLAVVAFVGVAAYRIVSRSGMMRVLESHHTGDCRTVTGAVGAEDVTIHPEAGVAYLSADDRRATAAGRPVRGEIYSLDLRSNAALPVPLTRGSPADFHPHGISLWRGEDGGERLFVINHPAAGGHTVEIFDVEPDRLHHVETVTYPDLSSPNDIVAVGKRRFYATNDRRHREGFLATVEAYLQLPWASVSYFDGSRGRIAADGIAFANGINASADGGSVYVAELLGQAVRVYDRDPDSGNLTLRRTIGLGSSPDNIEVESSGRLSVAAHPKIFDFLAHAGDAAKPAPSQVLRVDPDSGVVEEVFLDDGTLLSAAATAATAGGTMVLGPIFDARVLVCTEPGPR